MTEMINGVAIGIVKSFEDPDGEGRIQLEFPWLNQCYRSEWAPVAAGLAGPKRGAFFMPEIDDEVLVAFEQGNINHPYIVGFLWNGDHRPPESDRQLRVFLTPGGHTLRFEDKDNDKRIIIKTSGGYQITMDDKAQSVTIKAGNQQVVLSDQNRSVELIGGGRNLALKDGKVQIT